MAAHPAGARLRKRQHGQLNVIGGGQRIVHQADGGRIHQIFRILQHNHAIGLPASPLVALHRGIEPVEAVRLGGRPVMRQHDQPYARIVCRDCGGGFQRGGIVAIAADIDRDIALRPCAQSVAHHRPDNGRFLPCRNEHGGAAHQRAGVPLPALHPLRLPPARQAQRQPAQIDQKFVKRSDQEEKAGKQQQLALDQHEPFKQTPRAKLHPRNGPPPFTCRKATAPVKKRNPASPDSKRACIANWNRGGSTAELRRSQA